MTDAILFLAVVAVLAGGLVAGVFLTFSDFVMKSLTASRPAAGIESMQQINRKVYGSLFLTLFMAMAVVSAVLAGLAWYSLPAGASAWMIAGAATYLAGVFAVTVVCNVPMNKKLDVMAIGGPDTAAYWITYGSAWTAWNHLRSLASFAATVCFLVGCLQTVRLAG